MLFLNAIHTSFQFGALVGGDLNWIEGKITTTPETGASQSSTYNLQNKHFGEGLVYGGMTFFFGTSFFVQGNLNVGMHHDLSFVMSPELGIGYRMKNMELGIFGVYERKYIASFKGSNIAARGPILFPATAGAGSATNENTSSITLGTSLPFNMFGISMKATYHMKNNWKIVGKIHALFSGSKDEDTLEIKGSVGMNDFKTLTINALTKPNIKILVGIEKEI